MLKEMFINRFFYRLLILKCILHTVKWDYGVGGVKGTEINNFEEFKVLHEF